MIYFKFKHTLNKKTGKFFNGKFLNDDQLLKKMLR